MQERQPGRRCLLTGSIESGTAPRSATDPEKMETLPAPKPKKKTRREAGLDSGQYHHCVCKNMEIGNSGELKFRGRKTGISQTACSRPGNRETAPAVRRFATACVR